MRRDVAILNVELGGLTISLAVVHDDKGQRTVTVHVSDLGAAMVVGELPTEEPLTASSGQGNGDNRSPAPGAPPPPPSGHGDNHSPAPGAPPPPPSGHGFREERRACIGDLVSHLRIVGERSAKRRGEEAFILGEADAALIDAAAEGKRFYQCRGPKIPRNPVVCCAVLFSKTREAFLTKSKDEYAQAVMTNGELQANTISRSFASEAEA